MLTRWDVRESHHCTSSARLIQRPMVESQPGESSFSFPPCPLLTQYPRMSNTGSYFQTYLKRALDNLASAEQERAGEPLIRTSPAPVLSPPLIPLFVALSTPSAPGTPRQSLSASGPISPRAPRMSPGSSSGSAPAIVSPGQAAKLQQLQSMFGFSNTSAGRMD